MQGHEAVSSGYSRQRNPFLHPWFRTGRETMPMLRIGPHPAPCHTSRCHRYPIGDDCSSPGLGTCTPRVGLCVRFSIRDRPSRSPKTLTPPVPVPSRVAAPRQPIRRLSLRPLLLGVSSTVRACGLDACSIFFQTERATDGLLRSVYPFSATLGRYSTPCLTYRAITTHSLTG